MSNSCTVTLDCSSRNEVCANTAFFPDQSVCVSVRARDVYDHISQVESKDQCPVLLRQNQSRSARNLLNSHVAARVEGGTVASADLRKYLACVDVTNMTTCSAVLIAQRWKMSVAHCDLRRGSLAVIDASAREPTSGDGFKTVIKRVLVHPKYNSSRSIVMPQVFQLGIEDYDVVVAELEGEAPSSKRPM